MRFAIALILASSAWAQGTVSGGNMVRGGNLNGTPAAQTTIYLSQLPGVTLDANLDGNGSQTCTDNTAAINTALAPGNIKLIVDGASCISNTRTYTASYGDIKVCIDLWGKSNITIQGSGATTGFVLKSNADCAVISNGYYPPTATRPIPSRDTSNITLTNFRIAGNKADQTSPYGVESAVSIWNTSGLTLDGLYISDIKNFGTQYGNVDTAAITNNTILATGTGSDPIHFTGPFSGLTVSNNSLQSGDDCLALNLPEGYGGNGSNVVANNNVMTGAGCSDFVRVYNNIGGGGQPSYTLSNFTVDGVTGTATCASNPAVFYFGEAVGYGGDNALSMVATNIDVDGSGNCGLAQVSGSWARMDVSNATLRNAKPNYPAVQFTFAGQVATSTITNMTIQRNASGQSTAWPIQVGQYSNVTALTLSNNVVTDSGGSYSNSPQWVDIESVTNPGTVTTLTFSTPLDAKIDALFSSGSAARVGTTIGPP